MKPPKFQPLVSRETQDPPQETPAGKLANTLRGFYYSPLDYVMFAFPWDTDKSISIIELAEGAEGTLTDDDRKRQAMYRARYDCVHGPDLWACDFLEDLGQQIVERGFDGKHAVDPIQFATASGHGIGKSVMVSWLIKFILDTRPHSKGVVTAGTADQLKTKTWAELGKWHRLSVTRDWFTYTSGRGAMALTHRTWREWRCDAQTCREENSESFAGLHAANATPFFIFDEGSGVPDKIYEVRDGGTTDGEPMVFDFGNPTRKSGRFFEECAGTLRHRYSVRCIDSRTVRLPNKKRIQDWVDDFGEESDYVKVRVRGIFPSAGAKQFISTDAVVAAQERELVEDPHAKLVLGVDPSRFGDDASVIYPRRGNDARSFEPQLYRDLDLIQLAGKVIETVRHFRTLGMETAMIYIDGTGVGGGLVDNLRHLGYPICEVQFGGKPTDYLVYRNKSDEIWGDMRDAIKSNLCLPTKQQLHGLQLFKDLTQREFDYTTTGNKMFLETKKTMKERQLESPDLADGLAVTYAQPLAEFSTLMPHVGKMTHEYDPIALEVLVKKEPVYVRYA